MFARKCQKDVLKLVHPGGHEEIHRQPITAAEIMRKNPRHCITRPDVFEYPWIVVKPESVLNLGRVFFIVPNRTIYNLLKERGLQNQPPPYYSPNNHPSQFLEHTLPLRSYAGMTRKHQYRSRCFEQQCQRKTLESASPGQDHHYYIRLRRQSLPQYFQDTITKYQKTYWEFKTSSLINSRMEVNSSEDEEYQLNDEIFINEFPSKEDHQEIKHDRDVNNILSSCLRKPDSARNSLHLKVSFVLPTKGKDRPRRIVESRTEFHCFHLS